MIASTNPWDWMQAHDTKRMGDVILDPLEQQRWCRAVMLGGLPYMWRVMADTVRKMMYEKLELRAGDAVLIIGESVASCGFADDIQDRVGPTGSVRVIDITDEARDAYISGKRGRTNQLATWEWEYTRDIPDETFDCVAVLQAVQHTDDWREQGVELLRLMKPGRNILLGEITFSPRMLMLAQQDIHIEYWLEKIMSRVGWDTTDFPYYSIADLEAAFAGRVVDPHGFVWKGIELFWGTKP
jgi:ubiquinone/menaquinone biosynthesis C-methylase UbiE